MLYKFRYHLKWVNRKMSSCEFYSVFCGYYVPSPKLNIAPEKTTFPFGARPICRGELLNCMEFTFPRCSMGLEYLPTFKIYHKKLWQMYVNIPVPWSIWALLLFPNTGPRPSFSPWSLLAARKWPPQKNGGIYWRDKEITKKIALGINTVDGRNPKQQPGMYKTL